MKTKTVIILCAICLVVGVAICEVIDHFWIYNTMGGTVGIADEGKTETTNKISMPGAVACGPMIDISAIMRQGRFFTVLAENNCMSSARTYELAAICPVTYRPYSIQIQPFILAGYSNELKRFNVLAGGTLAWLWNYKYGSIGVGLTYAQGLVLKEYYVGASVIGQIDFGKMRN